jgi:hypothetical protein
LQILKILKEASVFFVKKKNQTNKQTKKKNISLGDVISRMLLHILQMVEILF